MGSVATQEQWDRLLPRLHGPRSTAVLRASSLTLNGFLSISVWSPGTDFYLTNTRGAYTCQSWLGREAGRRSVLALRDTKPDRTEEDPSPGNSLLPLAM